MVGNGGEVGLAVVFGFDGEVCGGLGGGALQGGDAGCEDFLEGGEVVFGIQAIRAEGAWVARFCLRAAVAGFGSGFGCFGR